MRARVLLPVLACAVLALTAPVSAQLAAPAKDALATVPRQTGTPLVEAVTEQAPEGAVAVDTASLLPDSGVGSPLVGVPGVRLLAAPSAARSDVRFDAGLREPLLPGGLDPYVRSPLPPVKEQAREALVGEYLHAVDQGVAGGVPGEHAAPAVPSRSAGESAPRTFPDPHPATTSLGARLGDGLPGDESQEGKVGVRTAPGGARATSGPGLPAQAAAAVAAAGLLALLPWALYHRVTGHRLLDQGARRRMHAAVLDRPGAGVPDLAAAAGVTYSTASYHLERLVAAGILVAHGRGARLAYYVNGAASPRERLLRPLAANGEALRVLAAVRADPGTHKAAVAAALGVSVATVTWHLKRLVEAELVTATRDGRRTRLVADEDAYRRDLEPLLGTPTPRPAPSPVGAARA